jgi:hypothetical protein
MVDNRNIFLRKYSQNIQVLKICICSFRIGSVVRDLEAFFLVHKTDFPTEEKFVILSVEELLTVTPRF